MLNLILDLPQNVSPLNENNRNWIKKYFEIINLGKKPDFVEQVKHFRLLTNCKLRKNEPHNKISNAKFK